MYIYIYIGAREQRRQGDGALPSPWRARLVGWANNLFNNPYFRISLETGN